MRRRTNASNVPLGTKNSKKTPESVLSKTRIQETQMGCKS
jgi:hypothetical protein